MTRRSVVKIRTLRDLGQLIGLPKASCSTDISQALRRKTGYHVDLDVITEECVEASDEIWQIEVENSPVRPRIRVRYGSRGAWQESLSILPPALLSIVKPDPHFAAQIRSTRVWADWRSGSWFSDLQVRSHTRGSRLRYSLLVPSVERKTGDRSEHVVLSVFGVEKSSQADFVKLSFPFSAAEFDNAVKYVENRSEDHFSNMAA